MGHRAPTPPWASHVPRGRGGPGGDQFGQGSAPVTRRGPLRHRQRPSALILPGQGLGEPWPSHGGFLQSIAALCKAAPRQHGSVCQHMREPGTARDGPWDPSMAPPAQAQRHGAGRAGASPEHPLGPAPQPCRGEPSPREGQSCRSAVECGRCTGPGSDASAGGAFWGLSTVAWYPEALGVWGGQGTGAVLHRGAVLLPPAPPAAAGPGAGVAFGLELPPPSAEPSPSLPSGCP